MASGKPPNVQTSARSERLCPQLLTDFIAMSATDARWRSRGFAGRLIRCLSGPDRFRTGNGFRTSHSALRVRKWFPQFSFAVASKEIVSAVRIRHCESGIRFLSFHSPLRVRNPLPQFIFATASSESVSAVRIRHREFGICFRSSQPDLDISQIIPA